MDGTKIINKAEQIKKLIEALCDDWMPFEEVQKLIIKNAEEIIMLANQ